MTNLLTTIVKIGFEDHADELATQIVKIVNAGRTDLKGLAAQCLDKINLMAEKIKYHGEEGYAHVIALYEECDELVDSL